MIRVNRRAFHEALGYVSNFCSTSSILPSLTGILITIDKKEITLSATNLATYVKVNLKAVYSKMKTAQVLVDNNILLEIVSKIQAEDIEFHLDNNQFEIRTNNGSYKCGTFDVGDFPHSKVDINDEKVCSPLNIGIALLTEILSNSLPYLAKGITQDFTNIIKIEVSDNVIKTSSTDKTIILTGEIKHDSPDIRLLIPRDCAERILGLGNILGDIKDIRVFQDEAGNPTHLILLSEKLQGYFEFRLAEHSTSYPDVGKLMKFDYKKPQEFEVHPKDIVPVLDRVYKFTESAVNVQPIEDNLKVESKAQKNSKADLFNRDAEENISINNINATEPILLPTNSLSRVLTPFLKKVESVTIKYDGELETGSRYISIQIATFYKAILMRVVDNSN